MASIIQLQDLGAAGEVCAPNFESVACEQQLHQYAEVCEAMMTMGIVDDAAKQLAGVIFSIELKACF